ncbi:DMT family transporter [Sulfobacillus thermosulfidooxidans]|uniref:DMT family transporter n=1 Tax=Sulfobacillus thermosulfidooxidans TaxID=28034 RepID=UPI001300D48E|nr:EamA family transporter [Sulfobacillus thermosulfidooxidans]
MSLAIRVSILDLLSLLTMNLIWAGTYPATAVALISISASLLTLIRLGTGSLVMLPFLWRNVRIWSGRTILRTAFLGVIGFSLPLVLQTQGLKASTPAMAAISIALEPLMTAVMASVLLKEHLSHARKWALAIAAFGAWAVAGFPRPGVKGYITGDILLVLAILCFAVYNVYSSSLSRHLSPGQATAGTFLGGFLGTIPIWLITGAKWPATWHPASIMATVYLALLGTALAYFLWMHTASRIPVALMALFLYLQPVLGVVLSMLLTPTHLSGSFVIGALAILGALYIGRDKAPMPSASA